jgi:hypothetical protein
MEIARRSLPYRPLACCACFCAAVAANSWLRASAWSDGTHDVALCHHATLHNIHRTHVKLRVLQTRRPRGYHSPSIGLYRKIGWPFGLRPLSVRSGKLETMLTEDKPTRWMPSFSDLVSIGTFVAAVVMWFLPPDWKTGALIAAIAVGFVIFAALRYPSRPCVRGSVAFVVVSGLVAVVSRPIWNSFHKDYPTVAFRWPITFGDNVVSSGPDGTLYIPAPCFTTALSPVEKERVDQFNRLLPALGEPTSCLERLEYASIVDYDHTLFIWTYRHFFFLPHGGRNW